MRTPARVLVIEDHGPLGRFITAALTGAGYHAIGPVANRESAMQAVLGQQLDLAVVDRKLQGEESFAIADALTARGVGCLLISGFPRSTLPDRFRTWLFLQKPFTVQDLLAAVEAAASTNR